MKPKTITKYLATYVNLDGVDVTKVYQYICGVVGPKIRDYHNVRLVAAEGMVGTVYHVTGDRQESFKEFTYRVDRRKTYRLAQQEKKNSKIKKLQNKIQKLKEEV